MNVIRKLFLINCMYFIFIFSSFAKPSPMPDWVQNYRSVYPDSEYLCQRGSGKSAEEAKTDATGALARYFQMNVSANLSTTMTSISSGTEIQEETAIINDVQVMSQVDFFGLEYTEPYYLKQEKKWYCVAFINRENAWIQYKPQIEIAKNTFEGLLKKLDKESDSFTKLKSLRTAWQKGKDLIEKLEYGRLISPTREAEYSSSRDKFSEIPVIFEETKSKCKTYISVQGDYNRIFTTGISTVLSECGFDVVKNNDESTYIAEVIIEDNSTGGEPLAITPTVNIKIVSKDDKTVFSYEVFSDEKTISYTLENAQKKAYPKLAEEIKAALKNEFENAFKL